MQKKPTPKVTKTKKTKTHRKPVAGRSAKKRPVGQTIKRQQRQQRVVSAVAVKRMNARQFKALKSMVLWIRERKGYRWLARYTSRGHGWWQQVGAGHSRRVAPTNADYTNVKRLHEILQADQSIDSDALTLLLEVVEARGQMDAALSKLINLVRSRTGQTIQ